MIQDSRRKFLKGFGALLSTAAISPSLATPPPVLPNFAPSALDENYWQLVREQFAIKKGYVMMNAANLCPCPYQVSEAVGRCNQLLEEDVSFHNRRMFKGLGEEAHQALADFLSVGKDEVIVTRNTSESNNIIVNGLDFENGDEVLLWEQNHPTNQAAWQERGRRMGFSVKVIALPEQPQGPAEILEVFEKEMSSKTRLVAFSHISNVSGMRLPAAEICTLARSKGILSLVDGAQSFGFLNVNLDTIGCDFYTGSAHKWLMGPKETGLLYVRKNLVAELWPNMVAAGYSGIEQDDIRRLASFGQRHEAALAGLISVIDFHNSIGKVAIEARTMALCRALRKKLSERIPDIAWKTPQNEAFSGGVLIFEVPGRDQVKTFQQLYEQYRIACAPTGGIRLSPHIYNTMEDVDQVVQAVAELNT